MSEFLGVYLKETRESKNLTIEDIANRTKIQRRYLEALESENFDDLPGRTYVRGFLKNYADELRIPAEEILSKYESLINSDEIAKRNENKEGFNFKLSFDEGKLKLIAAAALSITLIFVVFNLFLGIIGKKDIQHHAKIKVEKKIDNDAGGIEIKEIRLKDIKKGV